MLAVFPAMGAVMFYKQVYTQLFGEPKVGDHLQLLQGFQNKERRGRRWPLAARARSPQAAGRPRNATPSRAEGCR